MSCSSYDCRQLLRKLAFVVANNRCNHHHRLVWLAHPLATKYYCKYQQNFFLIQISPKILEVVYNHFNHNNQYIAQLVGTTYVVSGNPIRIKPKILVKKRWKHQKHLKVHSSAGSHSVYTTKHKFHFIPILLCMCIISLFLAVQNSSIGDLVTHSLTD